MRELLLGILTVLVRAGRAFDAHENQQHERTDVRHQADQITLAGLVLVVQATHRHGDSGHNQRQTNNHHDCTDQPRQRTRPFSLPIAAAAMANRPPNTLGTRNCRSANIQYCLRRERPLKSAQRLSGNNIHPLVILLKTAVSGVCDPVHRATGCACSPSRSPSENAFSTSECKFGVPD